MRGLLAAQAILFASLLALSAQATPPPQGPDVGPTTLVGLLTAQGDRTCDGGKVTWINPHHQAGFVRLVAPTVKLQRFENLPVILTGRVLTGWRPPPFKSGDFKGDQDCGPPVQMRADWEHGKSGTRIRRGPGPGFAAFKVTGAKPWSGLTARRVGETIEVSLSNDLGVDLKHLTLRLHYEGCYGKPGTMVRSQTRPMMRPGDAAKFIFPVHSWRKARADRSAHRAVALTLDAQSPAAAFDLNWPLSRTGIRVDCPRPAAP